MNCFNRRALIYGALSSFALRPAFAQMTSQAFTSRYATLLKDFQRSHPNVIRDFRVVTLSASARPWLASGIEVSKGDALTMLSAGRVYLSKAAQLFLLPRALLWTRISDADVQRPGSDTFSWRADRAGPLELATLHGRWSTRRGDHPRPEAYDGVEGSIDVVLIRWATERINENLQALAAVAGNDALVTQERRRLEAPTVMPKGFEALWYVGDGASFSHATESGEPIVQVRSHQNGGIIRAALDVPLERGLRLKWDWRMNQLPSISAENALSHHQYTSIALEFDDGQDLAWYWSSAMESGQHYRCPFPSWPGETHFVVRSGAEMGRQWVSETRDVFEDVQQSLPRRPSRVRGLWLIATTVFGERAASSDYRRISVADSAGHTIFPLKV